MVFVWAGFFGELCGVGGFAGSGGILLGFAKMLRFGK